MSSVNRPNKRYRHGFAVVRVDFPLDQRNPENNISVLKIFSTQERADAERERLSRINAGKNCAYFVTMTRLVDCGTSIDVLN